MLYTYITPAGPQRKVQSVKQEEGVRDNQEEEEVSRLS